MIIRRRQAFTLIEVIISMSLMFILIVVLLGAYGDVAWSGREIARARQEAFALRYFQTRLSDVLLKSPQKDKKKGFAFFTGMAGAGKSLVFGYDNGVSCEHLFANYVTGRIYLNKEGELCLATWPRPERIEPDDLAPLMKKEILLEGVSHLDFQFYYPLDEKVAKERAPLPSSSEVSDWEQAYNRLPVVAKLIVTLKSSPEKPLEFAFPLPNAREKVIYRL